MRKSLYLIKIMAAAVQLFVIFYLSIISDYVLGLYSFSVAIMAIIYQCCIFEGHQHSIAGSIPFKDLKSYYSLSSLIWLFSSFLILATNYFYINNIDSLMVVLIFVSVFIITSSIDWLININTIPSRKKKDDSLYISLQFKRGILLDIICPLIFIFLIYFKILTYKLLIAFLALTLISLIYLFKPIFVSEKKLVPFKYINGVFLKTIDSVFIRLSTGLLWGASTLGAFQPVLSVARVINLLTPLWVNLSLSKLFPKIQSNDIDMKRIYYVIFFSYVIYIIFAVAAWIFFNTIDNFSYSFILVLLAFLWFGGQNTKAFFRAVYIFDDKVTANNIFIFAGICLKGITVLIIENGNYLILMLGFVLIDTLTLIMLSFINHKNKKALNM